MTKKLCVLAGALILYGWCWYAAGAAAIASPVEIVFDAVPANIYSVRFFYGVENPFASYCQKKHSLLLKREVTQENTASFRGTVKAEKICSASVVAEPDNIAYGAWMFKSVLGQKRVTGGQNSDSLRDLYNSLSLRPLLFSERALTGFLLCITILLGGWIVWILKEIL